MYHRWALESKSRLGHPSVCPSTQARTVFTVNYLSAQFGEMSTQGATQFPKVQITLKLLNSLSPVGVAVSRLAALERWIKSCRVKLNLK